MRCPKCGKGHTGQEIPGGKSAICSACRDLKAERATREASRAAGVERGEKHGHVAPAEKKPKRGKGK